tara:strand:+ start:215 stop:391 length:177 start_codon:yes stop_codon:yes gene_type:complete
MTDEENEHVEFLITSAGLYIINANNGSSKDNTLKGVLNVYSMLKLMVEIKSIERQERS